MLNERFGYYFQTLWFLKFCTCFQEIQFKYIFELFFYKMKWQKRVEIPHIWILFLKILYSLHPLTVGLPYSIVKKSTMQGSISNEKTESEIFDNHCIFKNMKVFLTSFLNRVCTPPVCLKYIILQCLKFCYFLHRKMATMTGLSNKQGGITKNLR